MWDLKKKKKIQMNVFTNREAWRAAIHGVTKSWTQLRD